MPLHEYFTFIYRQTSMTSIQTSESSTKKTIKQLQSAVESAYTKSTESWTQSEKNAVDTTMQLLDQGTLRICTPEKNEWQHHPWLQKAILCFMKTQNMTENHSSFLYYQDKVPCKCSSTTSPTDYRIVPPTHVRYGAHIEKNCVLMPCFVNIGAFIGSGTMIDTWATVGSGAQIGKRCHISGGVGIGGVLEPPQATPTIIEDHCFIGARSEVAEGVIIRKGAVLAMCTFISKSTKIYDRTNNNTTYGEIPKNAVVVPGSLPAKDGTHSTYAAIIVKYADEHTRSKTSLNDLLRLP